ncbi:hypothetical protein V8F20_001040 [Naviculisporaceae sp. PSN 640]
MSGAGQWFMLAYILGSARLRVPVNSILYPAPVRTRQALPTGMGLRMPRPGSVSSQRFRSSPYPFPTSQTET